MSEKALLLLSNAYAGRQSDRVLQIPSAHLGLYSKSVNFSRCIRLSSGSLPRLEFYLLSFRLQIIYDCIIPDQPLWDIGCDHGYLGLQAHGDGLCSQVHLVDRSSAVIDELRCRVAQCWPEGHGRGLRVWRRDAEKEHLPVAGGTVVMAGLGIWTVLRIADRLFPDGPLPAVRLVLACTLKEEQLRVQLRRRGWRLQHEELFAENGHVRQLLACRAQGESIEPFWNGTALSRDNGLLQLFLTERRRYFSLSQSTEPDLVYLKQALNERFGLGAKEDAPTTDQRQR